MDYECCFVFVLMVFVCFRKPLMVVFFFLQMLLGVFFRRVRMSTLIRSVSFFSLSIYCRILGLILQSGQVLPFDVGFFLLLFFCFVCLFVWFFLVAFYRYSSDPYVE